MRTICQIFVIYILFQTVGYSCTCPIPKSLKALQEYEYEKSTSILIVNILKIDRESGSFDFEVIEVLKGKSKPSIELNGVFDKQCGPSITQLGKWLVYGNTRESKTLSINACGLSRSFEHPEYNVSAGHKPFPPPPSEPSSAEERNRHKERIKEWKDKNVASAKKNLEEEINNIRRKKN